MVKSNSVLKCLLCIVFFSLCLDSQPIFAKSECVILLHGLGRTHRSMNKVANSLVNQKYIVVNEDYPSTKKSIESIAKEYIPAFIQKCLTHHADTIHIVTHSMGGIVIRYYLEDHQLPSNSRIVMLSPPNHGSVIADELHDFYLYKKLLGPAGQELGTDRKSLILKLKPSISYQLGIITGDSNYNPFSKYLFKEKNDGKVSVSSAYLKGANDFLIVPYTHTFIMRQPLVLKQISFFLKKGHFYHDS